VKTLGSMRCREKGGIPMVKSLGSMRCREKGGIPGGQLSGFCRDAKVTFTTLPAEITFTAAGASGRMVLEETLK
jgi:hypothetical protein